MSDATLRTPPSGGGATQDPLYWVHNMGAGADAAPETTPDEITPTVLGETPDGLIPKMNQYPVSNAAYYQRLFVHDSMPGLAPAQTNGGNANAAVEFSGVLDPFAAVPQPNRPLDGVLLTFEQQWLEKGTALGRLAHSICLAPGEVTRVAMIEWTRRTSASDTQATDQSEAVAASTDQGTAMNAVQSSVAHETATGTSSNFTSASQAQMSASFGFVTYGGSASATTTTGLGLAATFSEGQRDLAASAAKTINQKTVQTSQAVRSRRSSEIQEVSQSEAQSATTRVVANYNHMHALTMMYFEVLQVFQLQTSVIRAERCVFIPMNVIEFTDQWLADHSELILGILKDLGWDGVYETSLGAKQLDDKIADRTALLAKLAADIKAAEPSGSAAQLLPLSYNYKRTEEELDQLKRAKEDMVGRNVTAILNRHQLLINQHIWMRIDSYRMQRLLNGKTFRGRALDGVDPKPVGVFGPYLALRWPFSEWETEAGDADIFRAAYEVTSNDAPEATVALSSGGFFGEAVLGQAVSAEKIDLTRFWNWKDSPIPILPPELDKIVLGSRASDAKFANQEFAAPLAKVTDLALPEGADLTAAINAVTKDAGFNKMNPDEQAKAVTAAIQSAQAGSASASQAAVQSAKNVQDFIKGLADSKAAEALTKAATTALAPGGEATTVLGGLKNMAAGTAQTAAKGAASGEKSAAKGA